MDAPLGSKNQASVQKRTDVLPPALPQALRATASVQEIALSELGSASLFSLSINDRQHRRHHDQVAQRLHRRGPFNDGGNRKHDDHKDANYEPKLAAHQRSLVAGAQAPAARNASP
jgi:hypothetical protein